LNRAGVYLARRSHRFDSVGNDARMIKPGRLAAERRTATSGPAPDSPTGIRTRLRIYLQTF
jgi:hypothetical protein